MPPCGWCAAPRERYAKLVVSNKIMIVAMPGCMASALLGVRDALMVANAWSLRASQPRIFSVHLVSLDPGAVLAFGEFPMEVEQVRANARPAALIIPPVLEGLMGTLESSEALTRWLQRCAASKVLLGSVCTGAFFLAQAGLLDGKPATTNPMMAGQFRALFPAVELQPERRLTEEGNILCAGSTTAFLDLAIRLIERFAGHEIAVLTAKSLVVDKNASTQLPYVLPIHEKGHSDEDVLAVQNWLEKNFARGNAIEKAKKIARMSERSLNRRFKVATGDTMIAYLHKIRVEAAKRLLETTRHNVGTITASVGYEDERSFRRLFTRRAGISPREYRKRFSTR